MATGECPTRHPVVCVFALADLPAKFLLTDVSSTAYGRRSLAFDRKRACNDVTSMRKTVIVTGGSKGIGAGLVKAFLDRSYNVVANARDIKTSNSFEASDRLALVDG